MEIITLTIFTFTSAAVGTTTSFGTTTFMLPVLGLFYQLSTTLLFTGIIHWFGNIWKMLLSRSQSHHKDRNNQTNHPKRNEHDPIE